ncbi:MAG TPA: hypothetical protein VFK37_02315 [Bacillales bacterium]|nr:hypothetical protein [Bacillales bacterium]
MLFTKLLNHYMKNNHEVKKIEEKLLRLETELQLLSAHLQQVPPPSSPTIIEKVNVEKIFVDQIEHNNNFGALGIKSLEGRLNIGANYGLGSVPSGADKKQKEKTERSASSWRNHRPEQTKDGPVYHIHPKNH